MLDMNYRTICNSNYMTLFGVVLDYKSLKIIIIILKVLTNILIHSNCVMLDQNFMIY